MIKPSYILLICTLFCASSNTLQAESFNDYLKSQQNQTKGDFKQFKSSHEDEFEAYKKQLQEAFKQYKKSVSAVWGNKKSVIPSKKQDVSYQNKLKQRTIIDYKKGLVKVDIALDPRDAKNKDLVRQRMQQALKDTLKRGRDKRSIIDIAKNPSQTKTSGPALLAGLIQTANGDKLTGNNTSKFIKQQSNKLSVSKTRGNDKKPRIIVSTSFPMIPNHIKVRASKYKKQVTKYSSNMKLPPELVYAIMETESAFNPNARSSVPAFGLMQLVPTSGARDAYRLLFKKDKVVSDRYLYNPDNNIKLGTAFINKLYYSYLSGINNAEARTWAAIAAYNTGAGNVFNTFAGKYRRSKFGNRSNWKKKALSNINSKSPEQVYQYLKRNLPHKETQHYIQNIRKRIPKYKAL